MGVSDPFKQMQVLKGTSLASQTLDMCQNLVFGKNDMEAIDKLKGYVKGKNTENNNTKASSSGSDKEEMLGTTFWFSEKNGESEQSDPWLPNLSKTQRVIGFFTLLLLGLFCFVMAGLTAPFLILKLRKFVLLYTMGSMFTIGSFAILWGPWNHMKHICSYERLPFTIAYFGTMSATLYFAIVRKSTLLTLMFATLQIVSLAWYIFSYLPGGVTGLKFFTKLFASACAKTVSKSLPI